MFPSCVSPASSAIFVGPVVVLATHRVRVDCERGAHVGVPEDLLLRTLRWNAGLRHQRAREVSHVVESERR